VDRLLLESGAPDGYLLEDGSGVLLLEEGAAAGPIGAAVVLADDLSGVTQYGAGDVVI
jgi:hypothetical protein